MQQFSIILFYIYILFIGVALNICHLFLFFVSPVHLFYLEIKDLIIYLFPIVFK